MSLSNVSPNRDKIAKLLQQRLQSVVDPKAPYVAQAWNAILRTATGQKIINMYAEVAEFSQFSIARAVEETAYDTAELESSIRTIVRTQGVRMTRKIPAGIDVVVSRASAATPLTVQRLTTWQAGGVTMYNRIPLHFPIGVLSVSTRLYVGAIFTASFTGTGADLQTFTSQEAGFVWSDGVSVDIDGSTYYDVIVSVDSTIIQTAYQGLWYYPSDSNPAVQDQTLIDGNAYLIFGTELYGLRPPSGSNVQIVYAITNGSNDNDPGFSSTITSSSFPALTVSYETTAGGLTGGADETPYENYKIVGPELYASKDRAVTRSDHHGQAITSNVIDAIIWGQAETAPNDRRYMNVVTVSLLKGGTGIDQSDYLLSPSEFTAWQARFEKLNYFNMFLRRVDPIPSAPDLNIVLVCANFTDLALAVNAARQALTKFYKYRVGILRSTVFLSDIADIAKYSLNGIKRVKVVSPTNDIVTYSAPTALDSVLEVAGMTGPLAAASYNYAVVVRSNVYNDNAQTFELSASSNRVSVNPDGTQNVVLNWRPVVGAYEYLVYGRGVGASNMGLLATLDAQTFTFTDDGTISPNMGDLLSAVFPPQVVRFPSLNNLVINAVYESQTR